MKQSEVNTPENISGKYDFFETCKNNEIDMSPVSVETLQVNITKLCNQACVHCHVDASPRRKEQMSIESVNRCIEILEKHPDIKNLDITGGAPELNPHFEYFVEQARKLDVRVMVRHNLTVTIDGNPVTGESKSHLPAFFAENQVEVISSLPYYRKYFTDKQRGKGVFDKSIESVKLLNSEGYGIDNTGLKLNFVYNPAGAFLPPSQKQLEKDFKKELGEKYGIKFNVLFALTNIPINRFMLQLLKAGAYNDYMEKLVNAFNPSAASGVMCRSLLSVDHEGKIYDCDFNQQMENMEVEVDGEELTIFNFEMNKALSRTIRFRHHCFGCTAGAGSSCGGSIS